MPFRRYRSSHLSEDKTHRRMEPPNCRHVGRTVTAFQTPRWKNRETATQRGCLRILLPTPESHKHRTMTSTNDQAPENSAKETPVREYAFCSGCGVRNWYPTDHKEHERRCIARRDAWLDETTTQHALWDRERKERSSQRQTADQQYAQPGYVKTDNARALNAEILRLRSVIEAVTSTLRTTLAENAQK